MRRIYKEQVAAGAFEFLRSGGRQAIARSDNCQRIQIENLLCKQVCLNKSISAIFGNQENVEG
jgi:hypothetical protein